LVVDENGQGRKYGFEEYVKICGIDKVKYLQIVTDFIEDVGTKESSDDGTVQEKKAIRIRRSDDGLIEEKKEAGRKEEEKQISKEAPFGLEKLKVGELTFNVCDVRSGAYICRLVKFITDDPSSKQAQDAEDALKYLNTEEHLIKLLRTRALNVYDRSKNGSEVNKRILRIIESIGIVNSTILSIMNDCISKGAVEVAEEAKRVFKSMMRKKDEIRRLQESV